MYRIIDLGAYQPTDDSYGLGIAHDVVVGYSVDTSQIPPLERAVLFDPNGGAPTLVAPEGVHSRAHAINATGQIVGSYDNGTLQAFVWQAGMRTDYYFQYGNTATDVNAVGQIVGSYFPTADHAARHAYRYDTRDGTFIDLQTLGGASSEALAVNDSGNVVGWAEDRNGVRHAFFWRDGTALLDLRPVAGLASQANDINNHNVVVGFQTTPPYFNAVVWQPTLGFAQNAPGGDNIPSVADAVNDAGASVGFWENGDYSFYQLADNLEWPQNGCVWPNQSTYPPPLLTLLPLASPWIEVGARDIDEYGDITGTGVIRYAPGGPLRTRACRLETMPTFHLPLLYPLYVGSGTIGDATGPFVGPPQPGDPPVSPAVRDIHVGLYVSQLTAAIDDANVRGQIQQAVMALVRKRTEQLRRSPDRGSVDVEQE